MAAVHNLLAEKKDEVYTEVLGGEALSSQARHAEAGQKEATPARQWRFYPHPLWSYLALSHE